MVKISEIKKVKQLYLIKFEDDAHDKIYVTEDSIVKFMLSKGQELEPEKINAIIEFANYSRGKNLAIYYISFKTRTRHEVENYLITHEITEKYLPRILKELEKIELINDVSYTERYLEGKRLAASHGPYYLQQKLQQKGVDKDLIEEKLTEIFDEESQLLVAKKLAEKLAKSKANRVSFKQLKLKLSQALVSKGFSYTIANQTIENLELEADEEQEAELLEKEAEKAYQRLSRRYEGYDLKHRLSQSLARKGFDWGDISDVLRDYDF